ncbi:nucleic acid/nucleotide deaminase domain-containing protein [Streptomyces sp. AS02]|uniref:nucleic acid/nucleotide deaminase domain-containing protein n=1 Tax=Streptomyces sp. AS02 TaxID=2938946 RepID=UPI0020216AF5|nr:nucleic acid/nucleotide deaminase domain-containing protein [Streptomyces sp. AS02]MCL8013383.1 SUKH-4 family immunity protein [Streptomyces sp. AS02]
MTVPEGGFRHFRQEAAGDGSSAPPPPSVRRLAEVAVPVQVGPYFVTAETEPVSLQEFAQSLGRTVVQEECLQWARLGSDRGFEICADHDGVVRAVLLDWNEELRFVNSTPEAFAESLVALDRALAAILGTDQPQEASAAYAELGERLRAIDPPAFEGRENWWPLVLDDVRDTASAEWFAAFEIVNERGEKQILTQAGGIGIHPEERLWGRLRAAGVAPEQVLRIHTELEACFTPGHYCSLWLGQVFPDAQLTHNFPYGETAESRAEGIRLLREAAEQAPPQ